MGYRMIAVMSEGNSPERRQLLAAFGADIDLVPQAPGGIPGQVSGEDLALVEQRTAELVDELGAWRPDQFSQPIEPACPRAGDGTGTVGAVGWSPRARSSPSSAPAARSSESHGRSRRETNAIRCLAVEPAGAQTLAGLAVTNAAHKLQGAGYAMIPPQWDAALCDGTIPIGDDEAIAPLGSWRDEKGSWPGSRPAQMWPQHCGSPPGAGAQGRDRRLRHWNPLLEHRPLCQRMNLVTAFGLPLTDEIGLWHRKVDRVVFDAGNLAGAGKAVVRQRHVDVDEPDAY